MIGRLRVFGTSDGLAVEHVFEFSPRIARGVFRFSVQEPSILPEKFSNLAEAVKETGIKAEVSGLAYGEPGLYLGTAEDLERGERYSAAVAMLQEDSLKTVSIFLSAVELGKARAYFLRGEVHSDLLFSSDLKPGTVVAFRGAKVPVSL
jgi:hypothetical protein